MKTLNIKFDIGTGGTGSMLQIESAQDADTGEAIVFSAEELGRHFADREEVEEFLRGKFGEDVEIHED